MVLGLVRPGPSDRRLLVVGDGAPTRRLPQGLDEVLGTVASPLEAVVAVEVAQDAPLDAPAVPHDGPGVARVAPETARGFVRPDVVVALLVLVASVHVPPQSRLVARPGPAVGGRPRGRLGQAQAVPLLRAPPAEVVVVRHQVEVRGAAEVGTRGVPAPVAVVVRRHAVDPSVAVVAVVLPVVAAPHGVGPLASLDGAELVLPDTEADVSLALTVPLSGLLLDGHGFHVPSVPVGCRGRQVEGSVGAGPPTVVACQRVSALTVGPRKTGHTPVL